MKEALGFRQNFSAFPLLQDPTLCLITMTANTSLGQWLGLLWSIMELTLSSHLGLCAVFHDQTN